MSKLIPAQDLPDPVLALRIAQLALSDDPVTHPIAEAIGNRLSPSSRADLTIEEWIGLRGDWRSKEFRKQRDAILAQIATLYFPGLHGEALAKAVGAAIEDYKLKECRPCLPNSRPDLLPGLLFDIVSLGNDVGSARLRQIYERLSR
jgi:hypothetical protein